MLCAATLDPVCVWSSFLFTLGQAQHKCDLLLMFHPATSITYLITNERLLHKSDRYAPPRDVDTVAFVRVDGHILGVQQRGWKNTQASLLKRWHSQADALACQQHRLIRMNTQNEPRLDAVCLSPSTPSTMDTHRQIHTPKNTQHTLTRRHTRV